MKSLWQDESAQSATEYILLLAIVVGLAILFKGQIFDIIKTKMDSVKAVIEGFKPESS